MTGSFGQATAELPLPPLPPPALPLTPPVVPPVPPELPVEPAAPEAPDAPVEPAAPLAAVPAVAMGPEALSPPQAKRSAPRTVASTDRNMLDFISRFEGSKHRATLDL
jgi:hypothetical protein